MTTIDNDRVRVRQKLHSGRRRICRRERWREGKMRRANDIAPMERQDCFWPLSLSLSLSSLILSAAHGVLEPKCKTGRPLKKQILKLP